MYKFVTRLAEQQEPVLCQVVVLSLVHMVNVKITHTFVLDSAELASHIAGTADVASEHLPGGSRPKFLAFFCIGYVHMFITIRILYNIPEQIFL